MLFDIRPLPTLFLSIQGDISDNDDSREAESQDEVTVALGDIG